MFSCVIMFWCRLINWSLITRTSWGHGSCSSSFLTSWDGVALWLTPHSPPSMRGLQRRWGHASSAMMWSGTVEPDFLGYDFLCCDLLLVQKLWASRSDCGLFESDQIVVYNSFSFMLIIISSVEYLCELNVEKGTSFGVECLLERDLSNLGN